MIVAYENDFPVEFSRQLAPIRSCANGDTDGGSNARGVRPDELDHRHGVALAGDLHALGEVIALEPAGQLRGAAGFADHEGGSISEVVATCIGDDAAAIVGKDDFDCSPRYQLEAVIGRLAVEEIEMIFATEPQSPVVGGVLYRGTFVNRSVLFGEGGVAGWSARFGGA